MEQNDNQINVVNQDLNITKEIEPKTKKKLITKTGIFVVVGLLLMGGSAFGAYFWRDSIANDAQLKLSEQINSLQDQISNLADEVVNKGGDSNSEVACTVGQPSASLVENVIASIKTGNTQALEGYMADSVEVILAATEAYGLQTPSQAVAYVTSFIGNPTITTWDFSLPVATLNAYAASEYDDYFVTIDTVGRSSEGQVISFVYDCNGDISKVFMASSEELIN